jgi:Skp family chaperone for outer membrane proteins
MKDVRFLQLGWVIAAALIAVTLVSGFQNAGIKIGVVDMAKVVEGSDFGKQNTETFRVMKTQRESVLEFIDNNRVLTLEQATRIRDLSLKTTLTAEEQAELDRIKAEVVTTFRRSQELATKTQLTQEDRTLIEEYARRSQQMDQITERWYRTFFNDMQTFTENQKVEGLNRARAAIQEVAKAESYTVILEIGIAPFGANDISDAALVAMNAKK